MEANYGNKRSTLILSQHYPIYGSSACGILVLLGDFESKSIWGRVGELQCQILADELLQQLTS